MAAERVAGEGLVNLRHGRRTLGEHGLDLPTGAVHVALHRMEARVILRHQWKNSDDWRHVAFRKARPNRNVRSSFAPALGSSFRKGGVAAERIATLEPVTL